MKVTIKVANRREALALKTAMDDPETRAFVLIVGTLLPCSSSARTRILNFFLNAIDEEVELGDLK